MTPDFGALIFSLDFEIHWGVRDVARIDGSYRRNLLGVREAIPAILKLFEEFEISATWATVGLLFATSRAEAQSFTPSLRPRYRDAALNPYDEECGDNESEDPFHYAPSLITRIQATPGQEIGTHTFSHYYCLAEGQDRETFRADLASAIAIACSRGIRLTSIVFPRNEHNVRYDDVLLEAGISSYRGNDPSWMNRPSTNRVSRAVRRGSRFADEYLHFMSRGPFAWNEVRTPSGLLNIRATGFLRPYTPRFAMLEPLRLHNISAALKRTAAERRLMHLWWHPHNFGVNLEQNLKNLRHILEVFSTLRKSHGIQSLSMSRAAALAADG